MAKERIHYFKTYISLQQVSPLHRSTPSLHGSPRRGWHHATNTRLELALDRFTGLALPFHLQIIAAHTKTILQLLESPQPILVWQEVERASKSVRKLGSLLFEMEVRLFFTLSIVITHMQ